MAGDCNYTRIGKCDFDLGHLWNVTQAIYESCPSDSRLSFPEPQSSAPEYSSLTYEACKEIAGTSYSIYTGFVIYSRLISWKLPLLQLVAAFPRPSLNAGTEFFVIAHLLGDPIDTLTNLLLKLSDCQEAALRWQQRFEAKPSQTIRTKKSDNNDHKSPKDRLWKAFTLVTNAYDEWGMGVRSEEALLQIEVIYSEVGRADTFHRLAIEVAEALAADRATKYLPTSVALTVFIASIAISFIKTRSAISTTSLNTTMYIGIEAHGIAFSALFFWILPAVFLGSVIGISQTEATVPRILKRFHRDLSRKLSKPQKAICPDVGTRRRVDFWCNELQTCMCGKTERIYNGGIYSWKRWNIAIISGEESTKTASQAYFARTGTAKFLLESTQTIQLEACPQGRVSSGKRQFLPYILPYIILTAALASAALVSYRVPPDGFNCRLASELGIFGFWFVSALADVLISCSIQHTAGERRRLTSITYLKDLAAIVATLGFTLATVVGVLNKCYCWANSGNSSIASPQRKDVDEILQHRIQVDYPAVMFSGIVVQLCLIPGWIWYCYRDAMGVFIQRDDGTSNFAWLKSAHRKTKSGVKFLWEHAKFIWAHVLSIDVGRAFQSF